jgi:PleD family two-component response regulator
MITQIRQDSDLYTAPAAPHKVVVVNGDTQILDMLEAAMDVGHYDVVFVESSDHAYSQIRHVHPNLVILCMRIEEAAGFQVLSMLKLDPLTREIPVLTYTTEFEGQDLESDVEEEPALPQQAIRPTLRMH